jgi:hypothetical protein
MPSGTLPAIRSPQTDNAFAVRPMGFRLADADDRQKPCAARGFRVRRHEGVGLAVVLCIFPFPAIRGRMTRRSERIRLRRT